MDKRQRIAMQRAMVREAIGKLRAVEEMFAIEDEAVAGVDAADFEQFSNRVSELEEWVFTDSALA